MNEKKTGALGETTPIAPIYTERQDKGNGKSFKLKILSILSNNPATAIALNDAVRTGDARKYISLLRQDGHLVSDYRIPDSNNRKVYFIKPEKL